MKLIRILQPLRLAVLEGITKICYIVIRCIRNTAN